MDSSNIETNPVEKLTQEEKDSRLIKAAGNGLFEDVKECFNSGANLESRDHDGNTPLRLAARAGYFDIANFLIKAGSNVDAKNNLGSTPLMVSSGQNHPEIVKILIDAGANLNATADDGDTALIRAADDSPASAVLLVKAGADLEITDGSGETALTWASAHGKTKTVDLLINSGANVDVRSAVNTPLMLAVSIEHRRENAFRLISCMSDEQINFSIKTTPRKNEDIKIKERVQEFKKAVLENQKKMFEMLDAEVQDLESLASTQKFDSTVLQLSQRFPVWYTHRIPNDLNLVCNILHKIRERRLIFFAPQLNPETLLEEGYCRQNSKKNLNAINIKKSFFYDAASTISSGFSYMLDQASVYLPTYAKKPIPKLKIDSTISEKEKHEDKECRDLIKNKLP